MYCLTLSQTTNFKELADKILSLMKMMYFSKQVENTDGKGKTAPYEQFLLLLQCSQKTCTSDTLKPGLIWERVKAEKYAVYRYSFFRGDFFPLGQVPLNCFSIYMNSLTLSQTCPGFYMPAAQIF